MSKTGKCIFQSIALPEKIQKWNDLIQAGTFSAVVELVRTNPPFFFPLVHDSIELPVLRLPGTGRHAAWLAGAVKW